MNYAAGISPSEGTLGSELDRHAGDVVIRPSRLCVTGPLGEARVEPKGMVVLLLLADAGGETVLRRTIYEQVWGGVVVGDDSLNRAIHIARRALREAGSDATIETIPRIGYHLAGLDAPARDRGDVSGTDNLPPALLDRRNIVAGVALAGALGLAGWGLNRQRNARKAAGLVSLARWEMRAQADDVSPRILSVLRQATTLQPEVAAYWGLLAFAAGLASEEGSAVLAESVARRALSLDAKEPYARLAQAGLRARLVEWTVTESELRRVLADNSQNAEAMNSLAFYLQGVGRVGESFRLLERASQVDPLFAGPQFKRAIKLWILGRISESDQVADRAMQLWPRNTWVWNARFMTFMFSGREGAARAMLADTKGHPEPIAPLALATWGKGLDALEAREPRAAAAAREAYFAAAPRSPGMAAHGIMALAALGEVDAAYTIIDMLLFSRGPLAQPAGKEKSNALLNDAGWRQTQWLFTPAATPVREDPRFAGLCERIGLAAYWRKSGSRPDSVRSL